MGILPRVGAAPSSPWREYALDAASQLHAALGDNLQSVALRGTSARNATIDGVSDLDLVAFTHTPIDDEPEIKIASAPNLELDLFCTTTQEFLENDKVEAWLRFNLAHSGYSIWGDDLISTLPEPKLDATAIAHMRDFEDWLQAWPDYFDEEKTEIGRKEVCTWLMKRITRAAFECVMLVEGAYTRDLHPCVQIAIKHWSEHEETLTRAAELAVQPTATKTEIQTIADKAFGLLKQNQPDF